MKLVFDASSIFEAILRGRVRVLGGSYTLDLAKYELGNVLWKRAREDGEFIRLMGLIKRVLGVMEVTSLECRESEVLKLAEECGITFYDASYAFLAMELGVPLVTEDGRLRKGVEGRVEVMELSDL